VSEGRKEEESVKSGRLFILHWDRWVGPWPRRDASYSADTEEWVGVVSVGNIFSLWEKGGGDVRAIF